MRQISIIYESNMTTDFTAVKSIEGQLRDMDYQITSHDVGTIERMNSFLRDTTPENCQFVVGFNLAGYSLETTGGLASINRLPMNMIQVISLPLDMVDELLKKTQSYMVKFLFSSEQDATEAKRRYPHIWNIGHFSDIDDIVREIESADWRY